MTCIITYSQSKPAPAVHLATDSRALDAAGNRFTIPKILPVPTLGAALAVMGTTDSLPFLAIEICKRASNFADAVDALPEALRAMQAIRAQVGDLGDQIAVLVGFRDTAPQIWACATTAEAGFDPWIAHDAGAFFVAPGGANLGLPADTEDFRFGALPGAIARARDAQPPQYSHLIGGAVTVTSVFRDRIEQKVVGVVPEVAAHKPRLRVFGL